jgi:hypothetical protein
VELKKIASDRKDTIMVGIPRKILGIKRFLSIIFCLLLIGCFVSLCYGDEKVDVNWGGSVLLGPNGGGSLDFTHFALLPRVGLALHKKWDLELEGNFSYYFIHKVENLYLLGVNANVLFKPFQWGKLTPFLIAGVGLAYNNNDGEVWELGDSNTAGILQGGGGILYNTGRGFWIRGEYRFHHISDPFERDHGLNTNSFILGVTF